MKREFCEQVILECEQLGQNMGDRFLPNHEEGASRGGEMETIHSDGSAGLAKR